MNQRSSDEPEKLYYRIREVSRMTGVKAHVLRYWESEFPALKPEKGPNDQRRYRAADIELILRIKKLLYEEKFTIAGARRQLRSEGTGQTRRPPIAARRNVSGRSPDLGRIANGLSRVKRDLADLQTFLAS